MDRRISNSWRVSISWHTGQEMVAPSRPGVNTIPEEKLLLTVRTPVFSAPERPMKQSGRPSCVGGPTHTARPSADRPPEGTWFQGKR